MKIGIVQLSDIHIKEKGNSVFSKKEKIVQAFQNEILECEKLFVVVSGDIAYSGEEKEYLLAMDFFSDIRELLIENPRITPYYVFIPGNHDCKFDIDRKAIRELIISTLQEKGLDALNSEMIQECCASQEKYFDFVAYFEEDEHINFNNKLLKINSYQIGDHKIVFNCYNTSWISELHEQPGKMLFPYKLHSEVNHKHRGELNISLVHHPLNWLDPINANEFKKHLEEHSEIILTGHEHNQGTNIKHSYEGKQTIFLEGGVLQDSQNSDLSEFNMILLDLDTSHQKVYKYKWNRNIYNLTNPKNEWIPFSRGVNGLYLKHQINKDFEEKLNDPGTSFYHSRKQRLILDDIFVYPNLKEVKISKSTNKRIITKSVNCLDVIESMKNDVNIILCGEERSGKSTLCKALYKYYYDLGYTPVVLDGNILNSSKLEDVMKVINKQYLIQYSENSLESFKQMENGKKIVIIDDFQKARLNVKYRLKLLDVLTEHYPNVIVTANSLFIFEDILISEDIEDFSIKKFKQFEIKQFGPTLRLKLINLWNSLGQDQTIEENELFAKNDKTKKMIDTVIGNKYVPAYPFFLLTLLQANEIGNPLNLKESSYGHYYDFLIKTSLAKININNEEIDAYYSYLTELAFYFFQNKLFEISSNNLLVFHENYFKEYDLTHDFQYFLKKLIDVSILSDNNNQYSFIYKYVYYYFVARYLANNISEDAIKNVISNLCKKLYIEEFANIIMFLTHMSKDPYILSKILETSQNIFSEYEPAKLESDILFINQLIDKMPELIIKNKKVREAREEQLKLQDENELTNETQEEETIKYDHEDENELDVIEKLNLAFKAIEIIGQVLKNHYGSIKGNVKQDLCQEAYRIGLRSLGFIFSSLNEKNLVDEVIKFIQESDKAMGIFNDEVRLKEQSYKFIFNICYQFTYHVIKKISGSVGSDNLKGTYRKILDNNKWISWELIDVSIKLEHHNSLPIIEMSEINEKIDGNYLASILLRQLVADYLYLFEVDYKDKQKICTTLGIRIENQIPIVI